LRSLRRNGIMKLDEPEEIAPDLLEIDPVATQ